MSGDTTTDGLARIENVLAAHPALVLLEFGGDDGLRGTPVRATKDNLEQMITRLEAAKIPTVLLGITLPPNYGADSRALSMPRRHAAAPVPSSPAPI